MRNIPILCLFALTTTLSNGAIETAIVEKSQRFFQVDQTNVNTDSALGAYPDGGEIYTFWAAVEGEGISGLDTPLLAMPPVTPTPILTVRARADSTSTGTATAGNFKSKA